MKVISQTTLPDGGVMYVFEDGTSTVHTKSFLAKCEKMARRNKIAEKRFKKPLVTAGEIAVKNKL